jgi:PAS domain S-box-containing protein
VNTAAVERAILASERFWSMATDATGVIERFSAGAERKLGYATAAVVGRETPASLADPGAMTARANALSAEFGIPMEPGFAALVFNARQGGEDIYATTFIRKDGGRVPTMVSATALLDGQGEIRGFLLICLDHVYRARPADARTAIQDWRLDRDLYTRALIDSNPDPLLVTDATGIITDVNRQAEALTGCTKAALTGRPFKLCFTDPARAWAGTSRALIEGRVADYELTAPGLDGTFIAMSYNVATYYDREQRLLGTVAAGRDMTAPKRVVRGLRQANAALEDATRLKSEFLAHMSHELRTPLNSIIGLTGVLKDGLVGEVSERQRVFLALVLGGGQSLLSVVNDILDLSKVEAGRMVLHLERVDVSLLFAGALSLVRAAAASRDIRIKSDIPAGLFIDADAYRIKQVVHNLIANAVKFTNEGGEITIHVSPAPATAAGPSDRCCADVVEQLADPGPRQLLSISVTGIGMAVASDGAASLFTPFNRLERQLPRESRGTGLELALVRQLTELHGGEVAVDYRAGEGACLTVRLPVRALDAREPRVPDAFAGTRTVLMVEADVKSAVLLRGLLETEGFRVLHAVSAEAALALASEQTIALITLDLILPGMDGWEFLHRLQQMPRLRRIPVVIISMAADQARGFALGAAAVMRKPVSRHELCQSLGDMGLFPAGGGQTLRVLIADDDPKSVELIAVRIQGMVRTVLRAFGGAEAIETARRERPNLILLDLMMPGVNGFDVIEALKLTPETAAIPILVLTAKQVSAADRARLKGEMITILEKSAFDSEQLRAEVRRAIAGRPVMSRGANDRE